MKQLSGKELTRISAFTVTTADTDMYSRIQLGACVNLLIQASIHSADDMGHGFKDLNEKQLFWVLSRMSLNLYRPLKRNEAVEVETWAKGLDRLYYLRDYLIRDEKHQIIGKGTSGWLAIDLQSKRPKIIKGENARLFEYLKGKHAMQELPETLDPVKTGDIFRVKSAYFDIDLNEHVTSTRYVDWMMDTFSPEFHKHHYPKWLSVNYIKETKPLETIRITRNRADEGTYLFEGYNTGAETTAFRGKIVF